MVSSGLLAVLLCVAAAFADVLGGVITVVRRFSARQIAWLTALGAGFLIGATFMDRLPDALSGLPNLAPALVVLGYLGMLLLQQMGGHHPHPHGHAEPVLAAEGGAMANSSGLGAAPAPDQPTSGASVLTRQSALVTFFGMVVHTFMDGVIIAGAFATNTGAGVLMFIAITLHKIPEGFTMATLSLAAGESRRTAFASASGLALSTLVGAVLTLWAGQFDLPLVHIITALATGTFIFISTTGLIPSLHLREHPRLLYVLIVGVLLFFLSLQLVHHLGLQ
ncbi:divalent cation transporter [Alicyclobacillus contaminans]|uniref:ZIP family metal transporter n=1 Tax=Alicyclobacillus contaminans TaxID=392016 RepID=UPI00040FEC93|nr:ZIP family metal transporter [Alicyclobacillus contaminans]GMA51267.1 divalent cation transporter [Alicyclobacillus contaminans]